MSECISTNSPHHHPTNGNNAGICQYMSLINHTYVQNKGKLSLLWGCSELMLFS